jgi:hypothetical protein
VRGERNSNWQKRLHQTAGENLMAAAIFQINIIPKRMLNKSEAAHHCGRSITRFLVECPVLPIRFSNGDVRWDVQDLDHWLDSLKAGTVDLDADAIVARLGT